MDGQLEHFAVRVVGQVSTRFIGANIMTKSRRRLACSFVTSDMKNGLITRRSCLRLVVQGRGYVQDV